VSGFSADWLDLREPADHAARNAELRERVVAAFAGKSTFAVVDIGSGAGSNLRGLAPFASQRQRWRLVDNDPALLDAARERLYRWADRTANEAPFTLEKDSRHIGVAFHRVDLSSTIDSALDGDIDLVVSAAFFDLVSAEWIERFADALAARRLPLYSVLTYSGEEARFPAHEADADMLSAFHKHQGGDKGFGAAAGPRANALLHTALTNRGYQVDCAPSPWRLERADAQLIGALDEGVAQAARETGLLSPTRIEDWLSTRRERCDVGHWDLFAQPK